MQLSEVNFDALYQKVKWHDARTKGEKLTFGGSVTGNAAAKVLVWLLFLLLLTPILYPIFYTPKAVSNADTYLWLFIYVTGLSFMVFYYFSFVIEQGRELAKLESFTDTNGFTLSQYAQQIGLINYFANKGEKRSAFAITGNINGSGFELSKWLLYIKTNKGNYRRNAFWNTVRIDLGKKLPHMIFDNKTNNRGPFSNLPESFAKGQLDSFEGDLHKWYTIYAPEGYGIDIRTVFTPEVLWKFRELATQKCDFEIIDNWLVVYKKNGNYVQNIQLLLTCGVLLAKEIIDEAGNYKDERALISGTIALQGRRLKPALFTLLLPPLLSFTFVLIYGMFVIHLPDIRLSLFMAAIVAANAYFVNKKKYTS